MHLSHTYAQTKNKQYQGLMWFRYNTSVELPKKFLWKAEIENRMFITKKVKQNQVYFRFTFDKMLPKNWNVGIGFSAWYYGNGNELLPTKLMIPEWRPHIEFNHKNKVTERFNFSQRFRTEFRFVKNTNKEFTETTDGYTNSFRFRYMMTLDYAVYKKDDKSLQIILFDELMINAGKSIVRNIFDQNRFGISAKYNFNKIVGLELGYINWFQQRPSGIDFFNRQILRTTLHTNLEIKKKNKSVSQIKE